MSPQDKITIAAMQLRAGAPTAWDQFVAAMRDYSDDVTRDMLSADPAQLVGRQGRAAMLSSVAKMFATVVADYEKIEQRERKKS